MMDVIRKSLRDSKTARWTALLIVAFTMLCGYYVADVMSPLKPMIEQQLGWTSSEYGFFTGSYAWFNVFLGMLIFGGMLLDKMGARFTGVLASILMVVGCGIKWWAVQTHTLDHSTVHLLFWDFKSQVLLASVGFALFGMGIEIANVVAMGLQVGTARIGTALALGMGAPIAAYFKAVAAPVLAGLILLCVGLVAFLLYCVMDKKLEASEADTAASDEEAFHISDIGKILRIRGFWYITMLCALFYSAVFPFLKYAPDLMVQKFHINDCLAGAIPSILPFATIPLTVVFGRYYDRKGKGASLMVLGSLLLVLVHFIFTVPFLNSWLVALVATIVLGFAFSLVPSAMWPS